MCLIFYLNSLCFRITQIRKIKLQTFQIELFFFLTLSYYFKLRIDFNIEKEHNIY